MRDNVRLQSALDPYYRQIKSIILDRQHPVTGLLPASTAVTAHGDYRDAWVRDNVYSILAVWGLALAYRNLDDDHGRGFELEHATIKLMRGLLQAMMRQAPKVEQFKRTQAPSDALHAKYDTESGTVVVGDHDWGHLQIDATSLYLLVLAQMIASGLDVIHTLDEVNFVQNLVFYIDRAYRTPDYGIWERGEKMNRGQAELNASSVGMAKAALEALSGFDLFGARGSQASVVHVLPDNVAQADITLCSMLPRESSTKEVDAALLSVVGFPAFAVDDDALVERTRREIIRKLQGRYGLKRFLRDGHQTVLEDENRPHYEREELRKFEHIESEWPLFFAYLYLDALFRNDDAEVERYEDLLSDVLVERDGEVLLPELYYVPKEGVEAEKKKPGSQERVPNENVPLVWAQSLYLLGRLIRKELLLPGDIDPARTAPACRATKTGRSNRPPGGRCGRAGPARDDGNHGRDAGRHAACRGAPGGGHRAGLRAGGSQRQATVVRPTAAAHEEPGHEPPVPSRGTNGDLLVIAVRLDLEADALDAFRTLILNSARQSLANEPGCKRYEASFSEDGTACFVYEVYEDRDAFEAHLNTDHFAEFDRKAKGLIAGTRVEEYLLDAASA